MRQKIAKEILMFFSILLLTGLLYSGLFIYNYILKVQIKNKEILLVEYKSSIDSLNLQSSTLLDDNSIYKFLKENNLTEKEPKEFLKIYSNSDSSDIIYKFYNANNLTDLSQVDFIKKYLNSNDANTLISVYENIALKNEQLSNVDEKKSILIRRLFNAEDITNYSLTFLFFLIVLVYPIRFSYKAIKWAINALK
jgi:hypothetical protein